MDESETLSYCSSSNTWQINS